MKRLAFALHLALTILVSPAAAEPSMLNDSVMVRGSYVRLGDLFSNAGAHADAVVAYAPAPGKRAVFDANWLYRVAYRYKLPWRPLSLQDRAVVRRVSQVITREDIENRILAELRRRGYTSDVRVVLGNSALRLHIAGDKPATMAVEDFTYDRRSKRFTGVVVAPAGDPAAPRVRVTGRIYEIAEIPVLARGIVANKVIGKGDIRWIKVRADRVQRGIVHDAKNLVGMVPRRSLRSGTPIRVADVRRPVMVTKGSITIIVLRVPGMLLTATGRAQEDGSKGDAIRVSNTRNNTVLEAVVVGLYCSDLSGHEGK